MCNNRNLTELKIQDKSDNYSPLKFFKARKQKSRHYNKYKQKCVFESKQDYF